MIATGNPPWCREKSREDSKKSDRRRNRSPAWRKAKKPGGAALSSSARRSRNVQIVSCLREFVREFASPPQAYWIHTFSRRRLRDRAARLLVPSPALFSLVQGKKQGKIKKRDGGF